MILVGLTGNFGSGKSLVLDMFGRLGAFTLSADSIVDGLLKEKAVADRLREAVGEDVVPKSGEIDKKRMAESIFSNEGMRKRVEDVLHPFVFERMSGVLEGVKAEIAVVEVPLLFEGGYEGRFDKTVTVYTDDDTALRRLAKAGIERAEAVERLNCQMPIDEKKKKADYVIDNTGSKAQTKRQAEEIYKKLICRGRA